ncbi:MAG: FadR family transcriptional regulator [Lachnospiraceae bacterium]|nr:FadR family transcriptional regulator [Lachnospiraceae bacterium]
MYGQGEDMESSEFKTIKNTDQPLPSRAADQISQLIIDRQLSAGDKLPNEFELAAYLHVGRGTVREAVKLLVARNVLEIRRGKGTFIAKHPGQIDDPLGFAYLKDQKKLGLDLLEVRIRLEPWVAGIAAAKADEKDLVILRENCSRVEEDIYGGVDHLENDRKYHISIAKCTHNLVVPKLIPIISYSVGLFGSLNGTSLLTETIIGHRAILTAIEAHDPDAASAAMKDHLEKNRSALLEI